MDSEPVTASGVVVIDPTSVEPGSLRYDRGFVTKLVGPEIGASKVDLHFNRIKIGSAPGPYHIHTNAENVYYVFSGVASIRSGDEMYTVLPGQVVFIPPMIPHAISNDGPEELVIMEIYAPAGADFQEVD
ncbi:MAG TPA: cupin domain-containing protein [Acidimicrobiales bacterium]|nr:cupin domain-containing protein [Acidimicrobiales bacterium]